MGTLPRRGAVLVLVIVALTFLSGLAVAFFRISMASQRESLRAAQRLQSNYLAEAGLRQTLAVFAVGGRPAVDGMVWPQSFGNQSFDMNVIWGPDDAALADDLVRLTASAVHAGQTARLELLGRPVLNAGSTMGVIGKNQLSFLESSLVDSYDSSAGAYSGQATNTMGSITYAGMSAPVSSNGNIDLDALATIWGDAHPGTSGSVSVGGSAQVSGSTSPLASAVAFPNISVPTLSSLGNLSEGTTTQVLSAGDYHYDALSLSGTGSIVLTGPAVLVVGDLSITDASSLLVDATGGPVQIYVTGMFDVQGTGKLEPTNQDPSQIKLLVSGLSPDVNLGNDASVTGVLYAPDRSVFLSAQAHLFGSLVANDLTMTGSSGVHFDQNLLVGAGIGDSTIQILCWRNLKTP